MAINQPASNCLNGLARQQSEPGGVRSAENDQEWSLSLLHSLGLAFHVGDVERAKGEGVIDAHAFYELHDMTAMGDFMHIRRTCEGGFSSLLRELLGGGAPFGQSGDPDAAWEDLEHPPRYDRWSLYMVTSELAKRLAHLFAVAERSDYASYNDLLGVSIETSDGWIDVKVEEKDLAALSPKLRSPRFRQSARRYDDGFYGLFQREVTTLCRSPDVASYIRSFFDLWQSYVAQAIQRRGPATIVRIGFALPLPILEMAKQRLPNIELRVGDAVKGVFGDSKDEHVFSLTLAGYHLALAHLAGLLTAAVAIVPDGARAVQRLIEVVVPTYGIFASARSKHVDARLAAMAKAAGWPPAVALPRTHKVLLSADALEA